MVAAHYAIAYLYMGLKDDANTRKYFNQGKEAERAQLPFFLPYKCDLRDILEIMPNIVDTSSSPSSSSSSSSTRPSSSSSSSSSSAPRPSQPARGKPGVKDVRANEVRMRHRQALANLVANAAKYNVVLTAPRATPQPEGGRQGRGKAAASRDNARPIFIEDMDLTRDQVYKGRVLTGMLVEEPFTMSSTCSGNLFYYISLLLLFTYIFIIIYSIIPLCSDPR
jgi:hypothetical protein